MSHSTHAKALVGTIILLANPIPPPRGPPPLPPPSPCIPLQFLFAESRLTRLAVALCWSLSRALTEGLTIFLVQHGVGISAIRRSLVLGILWALASFGILYGVGHIQENWLRHGLALAYYSPPCLCYLLLAFLPLRCLQR